MPILGMSYFAADLQSQIRLSRAIMHAYPGARKPVSMIHLPGKMMAIIHPDCEVKPAFGPHS
jgi:hypothetical protein